MKKILLLFILITFNNVLLAQAEEEIQLDFNNIKKHTINNSIQNPNTKYNSYDIDYDEEESMFDNNIPREAMPPTDSINNTNYINPQQQIYNGLFKN